MDCVLQDEVRPLRQVFTFTWSKMLLNRYSDMWCSIPTYAVTSPIVVSGSPAPLSPPKTNRVQLSEKRGADQSACQRVRVGHTDDYRPGLDNSPINELALTLRRPELGRVQPE